MCEASTSRADKSLEPFVVYRKWWGDAGKRLGQDTVRQYRYYVVKCLADTGLNPLTASRQKLENYFGQFRRNQQRPRRAALVDFFDFLVRKGYRATNPMVQVKVRDRGGRRIKRSLTEDELCRLLIAAVYAGRPRWSGADTAWAFLAQYALGLRPGEMIALERTRVLLDGASSSVFIVNTKTGNDRIVPIGPTARVALEELLRGTEGRLVHIGRTQYWEKIRRAARMVGLEPEKCRPYALRHTFATHLRQRGVKDRIISELMGHSDLRALWGYTVPDDDELRDAVKLI